MSRSFLQRFVLSCDERPDKVAMRVVGDDAEVYTFGEMLGHVRAIASRLGEADVDPGDRVVLIGENHPSWAIAYLAILYRGAVCVPIDPHGEIETLTNFFDNSEARLAFLDDSVSEKVSEIESRLSRPITKVVWQTGQGQHTKPAEDENRLETTHAHKTAAGIRTEIKFEEWAESDSAGSLENESPGFADKDTALLIYTSGTTGTPKGVPLTHGNIVAELDGINEVLKLSEKEKILSLLPLFHAYLQIVNLWT
ncbi:MAG: long-chain fatty acid--CoA ligase, partial [Acidobacteria bacterium]|nr:long-chain fatty acid--CoA ligase [Acidobacteriota bacterium]